MWGRAKEQETTNFKPVEPEVPNKIYPNMEGTIVESMHLNEPKLLVDSNGEMWLAKVEADGLKITPADVTPRDERDDE